MQDTDDVKSNPYVYFNVTTGIISFVYIKWHFPLFSCFIQVVYNRSFCRTVESQGESICLHKVYSSTYKQHIGSVKFALHRLVIQNRAL